MSFMSRLMPVAILLLGCAIPLCAADANQVWPLPALNDAAAWTAAPKGEKPFTFDCRSDSGALFVRFDAAKENVGELRLKEPVPMPEDVTGFTFLCGNNGVPSSLWIKVLAGDSTGKEFAFHTSSWFSFNKGWFSPEHFQRRVCEERFTTPGFGRPKPEPQSGATLEGPVPNIGPKSPYTLLGLRFIGSQQRGDGKFTEFSLRSFAMTRLHPRTSPFYYQFRDREGFGELDPLPYLTPAHMGKWGGRRFDMSWELRERYDGAPFLVDGKSFEFAQNSGQEKSAGIPYPLQIAEKIEFPVMEKGTAWARVRLRWSYDGKSPLPQEIIEREFRLDVFNGAEPRARKPVPADAMAPNGYIRIAPARATLIFAPKEAFRIPVLFRKPEADLPDLSVRVAVKNAAGESAFEKQIPAPPWDAKGRFAFEADLSALTPGSYEITASLLSADKEFDRVTRLCGRAEPAAPKGAPAAAIPAIVPSWQELLARPEPILFLCPVLPDNDDSRNDAKLAWEKHYRPFLDEAGDLSKVIELHVPWAQVERLPGIYDWEAIDRFLDYAQSRGLCVDLWPEFRSRSQPEWLPSACEKDPEGRVLGAGSYLFHNLRPNFLLAPEIREPFFRFVGALARRYRGHPALLGYFVCVEHPRDAAYRGWLEGYSAENLPFFIDHCRTKFRTIDELNREWGTSFKNFTALRHPREGDPAAFRTGWLHFRIEAIEAFLKDFVLTVRKVDDRRLVIVYGDGLRDNGWFRDRGCMAADGGSAIGMSILQAKSFGAAGFHRRTEDIHPGFWASEKYPSEIEASLFNISAGGGWTTHAKCYVRTDQKMLRQQLADQSIGLGKMRKLWPVWRELHQAYAYEPQVYVYGNTLSTLDNAGHTGIHGNFGDAWETLNVERAQLDPCLLSDREPPADAKLVAILAQQMRRLPALDLERLARYAENGGTLLMLAATGRQTIGPGEEDWTLLRRLGFAAPDSKSYFQGTAPAQTLQGAVFPVAGETFVLREAWQAPYEPAAHGERLAVFKDRPDSCAVSWKTVGKGKAVVVWADTIVPEGKPFLQEIARWAGAQIRVTTDQPLFWTNLQRTKDEKTFYGMVNNVAWPPGDGKAAAGTLRWLALPDGDYQVTALVAGREFGVMSARKLREGLPLTLPPRGAEIVRMERR